MNKFVEVIAIVEGETEKKFIKKILAPYLGKKSIGIHATKVSKPGQKGGDVKFSRVKKDLEKHLKQRNNTYVTTFIDYYGTKEWPGIKSIPEGSTSKQIAKIINEATKSRVKELFPKIQTEHRFIPFIAVHEFEALLFSDTKILAENLGVNEDAILKIISKYSSPEEINNNPSTAPSKRLDDLCLKGEFLKTVTGISIAKQIGIKKMRKECPLFNNWLKEIETKQPCRPRGSAVAGFIR